MVTIQPVAKNPRRTVMAVVAEAAMERQNLVLGFAGIALGLVAYFVNENATVPMWGFLFLLVIFFVTVGVMGAAIGAILREGNERWPKILSAVTDKTDGERPVFLLEPSLLFDVSTLISVYYRDIFNNFEILLAHGTVISIQSDARIQVKLDEWVCDDQNIKRRILGNNGETLRQLIVRLPVARDRPKTKVEDDLVRSMGISLYY